MLLSESKTPLYDQFEPVDGLTKKLLQGIEITVKWHSCFLQFVKFFCVDLDIIK